MNRVKAFTYLGVFMAAAVIALSGCKKDTSSGASNGGSKPTFTLAWNQYPSSAVFPVAERLGLINGEAGKTGPLEEKWGVDLVLKETGYDNLITLYGAKQVDAVTIVNLDTMATAADRAGVAIIPVSTSRGGDAVVVTSAVKDIDDLKSHKVYGLEKSVSQYMFERNIEFAGKKVSDYQYANMDPEQVAQAMQTKQKNVDAGAIWNPYIMQTLRKNTDTRVLFGSEKIPDEIVDVIWAGKDSLQKPGGDKFGALIADIYYEVNKQLNDPATHDKVVALLAEKSNGVSPDDMAKDILVKTVFYPTADSAVQLLQSKDWQDKNGRVVAWGKSHGVIKDSVKVGYDDDNADVNFTTKYAKMAKNGK